MRRLAVPLTLLVLLAAGCVSPEAARPSATEPPAEGESDARGPVNLFLLDAPRPASSRVSGGAEPSILVSRDGATLWIGDTSGVYRSVDDGATWTRSPNPLLPGLFTDGWALAEDEAGTLYTSTTQGQVIGVAASDDGGRSWRSTNFVVGAAPIADRPWLAARGDGEVAMIFYSFGPEMGETCYFSNDGGQTFLTRSLVPLMAPANAGNAVFDSQGRLFYAASGIIWRWDDPCFGLAPQRHQLLGASGAQIFTQVDVDAEDAVYTVFPTPDNGGLQLLGKRQGEPRKILDVTPPALKSHTFSTLSTHGDEVAVAWYGSENAGNPSADFSGAWNVYVARIQGFWTDSPTITYDRITTEANHVGGFCMDGVTCSGDRDLLDYFMIDHGPDGRLHIAYGHDGAGSNAEVRYAVLPSLL